MNDQLRSTSNHRDLEIWGNDPSYFAGYEAYYFLVNLRGIDGKISRCLVVHTARTLMKLTMILCEQRRSFDFRTVVKGSGGRRVVIMLRTRVNPGRERVEITVSLIIYHWVRFFFFFFFTYVQIICHNSFFFSWSSKKRERERKRILYAERFVHFKFDHPLIWM